MPQAEDFLAGIDLKPTRFNPLTDLSPIERFSLGLQEVGAGLQKAGGYGVASPTTELVKQKMAEQALTNQSIIPMAQLKLHAADLASRENARQSETLLKWMEELPKLNATLAGLPDEAKPAFMTHIINLAESTVKGSGPMIQGLLGNTEATDYLGSLKDLIPTKERARVMGAAILASQKGGPVAAGAIVDQLAAPYVRQAVMQRIDQAALEAGGTVDKPAPLSKFMDTLDPLKDAALIRAVEGEGGFKAMAPSISQYLVSRGFMAPGVAEKAQAKEAETRAAIPGEVEKQTALIPVKVTEEVLKQEATIPGKVKEAAAVAGVKPPTKGTSPQAMAEAHGWNWATMTPEQKAQANTESVRAELEVMKAAGEARASIWLDIRQNAVLDSANNNRPMFASSRELNRANKEEPGRYLPAGPGVSALNKQTLMEDIRGSIGRTRDSLNKLTRELSGDQAAQIAIVMGKGDPGAVGAFFQSAVGKTLDPPQQDYVINLFNLREQAMAMRSVLGAGQGSDELRAAILRTVPGAATPSRSYAAKQLDAFEATLNRLERGIPGVTLKPERGKPTPGIGPKGSLPSANPGEEIRYDTRGRAFVNRNGNVIEVEQ